MEWIPIYISLNRLGLYSWWHLGSRVGIWFFWQPSRIGRGHQPWCLSLVNKRRSWAVIGWAFSDPVPRISCFSHKQSCDKFNLRVIWDSRSLFVWIMAVIFLKRAGVLNCPTITCVLYLEPQVTAADNKQEPRPIRGDKDAQQPMRRRMYLGVNSDGLLCK